MIKLLLKGSRGPLQLELQVQMAAPWTVLFGESGAGKSSILRAMAGLWQPRIVSFWQDDQDLSTATPQQRRCALLTQNASLVPHFTAQENVAFVLDKSHTNAGHSKAPRAVALLKQFRADQLADKLPAQLSAGEQQRVALARAVAANPRMLLLDEALTGLDHALRQELVQQIKVTGIPVIAVTHDVAEAAAYAEECLLIENGRATAQGPTRTVLRDRIQQLRTLLAD